MNDQQIPELFISGDAKACTVVAGWIETVVHYNGWGNIDKDDLKGEITFAVLENLRLGCFRGESLKAYVQGIARKKCLEEYRKYSRRKSKSAPLEGDPPDPKPRPDEEFERTRKLELTRRIWKKMSWTCKKMLVLRIHLNKSFKDVAVRLRIREGTARVRLHRCLREAHGLRLSLEGQ